MPMNPELFLNRLRLSSYAEVIEPPRLVSRTEVRGVAPDGSEEILLTRHGMKTADQERIPSGDFLVSAFNLGAPAGHECRVEIYPSAPFSTNTRMAAYLSGVLSGNEFGEVIITSVGLGSTVDTARVTVVPLDAAVLHSHDYPCQPVDWGCITPNVPLVIDYEAFSGVADQTLLLALTYSSRETLG